jgi:hypothetical protein
MVPQSFTVNGKAQTITFGPIASQAVGTPLTLSASASSTLAVSFASTTPSVCTVAGTTASFIATGTCTIQATQPGNTAYAAATMVPQSFTVEAEAQTIHFPSLAIQTVGTQLALSATASSSLAVSFASTTQTVCTVSGTTASFVAAGTCTIQATQAGNTTYAAAPMVSQNITVETEQQNITFNNPTAQSVGELPLTLSGSASSNLAVSFASTTQSVCTVASGKASFIAVGTCTIQATQAGNTTYAAATPVSQSFAVNQGAQSITFNNPGAQIVGTPLPLVATSNSAAGSTGLTVSFASTTPSVCTVAGTTATFIASGNCTIQATQAGNANYVAATMVPRSFTVNGKSQTINFAAIAAQTVGTPLALSASASSGLAVSFASTTQSVCTVAGTTATFIASGSCTIQATQPGNTTYAAATMVPQSFTVNGKAQTITFGPIASQAVGTPLTLSASASSALAVSFASTTPSVCTVAGTTATFIATGTCTIQATQPGNTAYAAATMVPQSFAVEAEAQTITFANPGAQTVGTPLTLSASATSTLAVSFASTTQTVCTVAGKTATFIASGSCTIQATQAGNTSYAAAPMVSQSFTVNGEVQSITFNNPTVQAVGELPLTLSASATSGLTVSFASTTPTICTVASGKASFIAVGTCTIQATQTGNTTYAAATMVPQSFAVNQGAQSITFNNPGAQIVGTPLPLVATSHSAAGSTGLTVSFASTTPSVCTVAGTTATFIASGTCTIHATQAGNANYAAATMVPQSFTVNGEAQTINFSTITTQTVGTPLPLSASATSGLTVSFASTTPSVCTVAGTTATFIASGTCTIQATQPGNTVYAAATMVPQSFTVNGKAQTINFTNPGTQYQATPLPLVASATSTLTVSFASTTPSVCTVSGTTATFIASGTCTIQATQAGNTAYAAAPMVPQSFTVEGTLAITNSGTLTPAIKNVAYSLQLHATGGAGGTVATGGTGNTTPYAWSVSTADANNLLTTLGLTLSSSGLLSGTPTAAGGPVTFTANLSDGSGHTATASLSISATAFSITIATPPPAFAVDGNKYSSGTFTATGGTGPYNWSIVQGSGFSYLPIGLGLGNTSAATNAITGTVTSSDPTGAYNFTVMVVDHNGLTATYPYTLTVYGALSLPAAGALTPAVINTGYSATINVSGGDQTNYQWTVNGNLVPTSGSPVTIANGITVSNTGGFTLSIGGMTTQANTTTLNVSVKDTGLNLSTGTVKYTILSGPMTPLSLTPSLGSATEGQPYTGSVYAGGGSSIITFQVMVNGVLTAVPTSGQLLVANGLSVQEVQNGNSEVMNITGTPTSTTNVPIDVTVTDTWNDTLTANYTITVNIPLALPAANPTSLPSATVNQSYSGTISASGGVGPNYYWWVNNLGISAPGLTVTLSNGLSATTTDNNTLSITGTPTSPGAVTFTVNVQDSANNNAGPVTYTVNVNPGVPTGYTVSGTITYGGSQTGWVYLELSPNSGCNGCNQNLGTAIDGRTAGSLASGKSFTIHGVPAGTYTLNAYMDIVGQGNENANDPTGSLSNLNVTGSGLSGQAVTLTNPTTVSLGTTTPTWDPSQGSGTFSGGAIVSFDPICNGSGCNNGGLEMPTSYNLQYSTDSTFSSGVTTKSFQANGGNSPWLVTGPLTGQTYYFRAAGVVGSTVGTYSAAEPTHGLLIGALSTGSLLSGTVTFAPPAGVTLAGGPLYVGCYASASGTIYGERIASPVSPQAYSVMVPDGTSCLVFGFLDQFSSGLIGGPGELSNTSNGVGMIGVTVNGATPNQNFTLPSGNSVVEVKTQTYFSGSGNGIGYSVGFQVNGEYKLPVAVELLSETPNVNGTVVDVVLPADIATDAFNNYNNEFDYWPTVTGTPVVGDSYKFNVTYSDGTSEQVNAAVTGVLSAFATSLSPTGTGVSLTPNFSWDYPSSASSYVYQFQLNENNGGTVWEIPQKHSSSSGFASTISPFITWDVDPTNTGDLPSSSYLSNGGLLASTNYNWSISAYDANMNEAKTQVSFETVTADLSLPASGPGPALAGYAFTGQIDASGGSGSGAFTVNGTPIPATGIGNAVSFTGNDGLSAYSTGSNTLYIVGTPTTAENVSLTVSVKDSFSDTASQTYTLVVSAPPTGGAGNANNAKLNGTYVCKSDGFVDATGSRWATVYTLLANGQGSFTTGGTYDTNTRDLPAAISGGYTGTYNIGADNNGITNMTATINGSATTATGSWAIALTSSATPATEFRTVRIDDVGATPSGIHGSSVCYLANTSAFASGTLSGKSFAFGMNGENSSGTPKAYVGRMTLSTESSNGGTGGAAGGTITSGILDGMRLDQTADNGAAFTGSYIAPDTTTGHFTFTLTPTGSSTTITFAVYIIDANRMFMLETAGDTGMLAGDMRTQLQSANTAAALLDGSSVLYSQAFDGDSSGSVTGYRSMLLQSSAAPSSTYASVATFNQFYKDNNGCFDDGEGENTSSCNKNKEVGTTATITLDTSNPGRATFSPGGGDSAFLYFFNAGSAFYLDLNGTNHYLQTGWLEAQTQPSSPPFANANIAGSFLGGSLPKLNSGSNDSISEGTLDSSGGMTGSNTTANAGSLQWDQPFSAMGTLGYSWLSTTYGAFSMTMNGTAFQSCIVITPVKSGATGKAACIENTSGGANVSISEQ